MLRHPFKKRTIDKIIEIGHWRGFQAGICDAPRHTALEYSSVSGWYGYNDVHRLAYDTGYREAQRLLAQHDIRRDAEPELVCLTWRYRIPTELYQQAYTMHHLFEASWKIRVEHT